MERNSGVPLCSIQDTVKNLQSWTYVYRRSFKYYHRMSIVLFACKAAFTLGGLSAFVGPLPLLVMSVGALFVDIVDKAYKVAERANEFERIAADYRDLVNMATRYTPERVAERECEIKKNSKFFPREVYLKQMKLNGYQFV